MVLHGGVLGGYDRLKGARLLSDLDKRNWFDEAEGREICASDPGALR